MKLVDAQLAAERLSVPPSWLLREARHDRIPHRRLGRYVRFSEDDIEWIGQATAHGPRTGSEPVPRRRKTR